MRARLRRAERLSESFQKTLLSWEHSGFSVHAGEVIEATQPESLERMARYAARAPIALARVFVQKDGRVKLLTPVHPKTGKDYVIFDPLDWVSAYELDHLQIVSTASSPIPEPGSIALLCLGLVGVGFVSRRRKAKAS